MLQRIVSLSLEYRRIVLAVAAIVLAYGSYAALHAKLDVFPEFVPPEAVIQTEAPGLSPEQTEALVTRPVESVLTGIPGVESVRSQSIQGLSIVTVVFQDRMDIFITRQLLTEQLGTIRDDLPQGIGPPKLTPLVSSTMDLLKLGLVSKTRSPMEIRAFADWVLRPRLQAVEGVASVGVMGGDVREVHVYVDPARLVPFGLSLDEVIAAAQKATGARGAGFIETENQRVVLQSEGQSLDPNVIGETIIRPLSAGRVRLKDVADVVIAPALKFGDASIQGGQGVLVKLLSQYGANTVAATYAVEEAMEELKPTFEAEGIEVYPQLHRPATFIETAVHHVTRSLYVGAALVVLVLFVFLLNVRTAVISLTAIPLSLLVAVVILDYFGLTLNTITLGGLAIAIGEVVDDAIIDVENIFRRLRENAALGRPRSVIDVVLSASMEVRGAVVYATFVVVLVFVPVLTMSGLQGRMFAPLGVAYISAILASLLVALTVTPALCAILLPAIAGNTASHQGSVLLRGIRSLYAGIISRIVAWPKATIGMTAILFLASTALFGRFGEEFLPEFREGHFVLQVSAVPGTSLPAMMDLGGLISHDLLSNVTVGGKPVIETVEFQAGRAELGEDPWGPHRSEFHVELKPDVPGDAQSEVQQQIRHLLSRYPGVTYEVLTFLGDRISESISGEASAVVVNLFGEELDELDAVAERVAGVIAKIPGAADVRVASPPGAPQEIVQLRRDRVAALGFRPVDVLDTIEFAYEGRRITQVYEGPRVYDVVGLLPPQARRDPEAVGSLLLRNDEGMFVPLAELADLTGRTGRYMVLHDGARRRQAVTCNVEGRDLGSFVQDAKDAVARLKMPSGAYAVFGGAAEAQTAARNELLLHSSFAVLAVILLLTLVFRNWRNLTLVLLNLPFAFVGGAIAVALTGGSLSIGSMVGFVTLFGITLRNSVMMISHFEYLVQHEGQVWDRSTAVRGASERLVPVLMTALVTGLGLLPIALGAGEVGREIEGPLAIVIVGGLCTSTLLTLFILPSIALRYGRFVRVEAGAAGV